MVTRNYMTRFVFFVICILGLALPCSAIEIGEKAPNFSLADADKNIVSLEDLKGSIVVLEWFNKGCPFVLKHYKNGDMQAMHKLYEEKGVKWIMINSTNPNHRDYLTAEQTKELLKEWKIENATVLLDETGSVGQMYGAKATPNMYVIDASGVLKYQGAIDDDADYAGDPKQANNYVEKALDSLIAGAKVKFIERTEPYGCSIKY